MLRHNPSDLLTPTTQAFNNLSINSIRASEWNVGLSCDLNNVDNMTSELSVSLQPAHRERPCGSCSRMCTSSGVQQQQQHAKSPMQQYEDDAMAAYTHTGLTDRISEYVSSSSSASWDGAADKQ